VPPPATRAAQLGLQQHPCVAPAATVPPPSASAAKGRFSPPPPERQRVNRWDTPAGASFYLGPATFRSRI
jgi:hypothetical protein